jgi:hypothetical protein
LKKAGTVVYTYDSNDPTDPRRPLVQHPNPITKVSLNDERNNCGNDGNVYGTVMGFPEAVHIAKSCNKPIVDIGSSQRGLNGLQQEDKISCSKFKVCPDVRKLPSSVGDKPRNFMDRLSCGKL